MAKNGKPKRIEFIVPAVPVAQPRPRAAVVCGHAKVRTADSKHPINVFKATVRLAASAAYSGPPLEGHIWLALLFVMPRPRAKCWKKKPMPREWYSGAKDRDNLQKGLLDALNGLTWCDDKQVVSGPCDVVIASGCEQPHVSVVIETLDDVEPPGYGETAAQKVRDETRELFR